MERKVIDLSTLLNEIGEENYPIFKKSEFFNSFKIKKDTINSRYYVNCFLPSIGGKSWDRFESAVERVSDKERVPIWTDIIVTGKCHCNCWHCFRSNYTDNSDLDIKTIEKVIKDAYDLGAVILGITGGEPMLRNDIMDILKLIPDEMEGMFYTTGYKIDEKFAKQLADTNVTRCLISLDHYDKNVINKRRGNTKAFDSTIDGIKALVQENIYTAVTLCVTEDLIDREQFYQYIEFTKELKVDEIRVILPIPQGNILGKNYKRLYLDAIRWTRKIRDEALENSQYPNILLFSEFEGNKNFGCGAGNTILTINNDGQVNPCVCVPLSIGNVKREGLKKCYEDFGEYFKTTGKTCYGKRISKTVVEETTKDLKVPYDEILSKKIMEKHIVDEGNAKIYR